MCALSAIGIFPKTTGALHITVSIIFFLFLPFSLFIIGRNPLHSEKNIGVMTIILGVISLSTFPFFLVSPPVGSNALIELISLVSLAIFTIMIGTRFVYSPPHRSRKSISNRYQSKC
jgi:hypothetical membrane protein